MKHNRRSTDRRQGRNGNSNGWAGPERRGTGRPPAWEMAVLPLESRILYTCVGAFGPDHMGEPDTDMPYVFDVAATNETLDAQAGATGGAKVPVSGGVPILHSRPGAAVKLIIDFDGDAARTWGSYNVPATPAYDQDGDATTFNTAELASINEIFLRVAEKYSPFDVDVTTADSGSYSNKVSVKVVVGGAGAWLGSVAGGIAYIGAFYNSSANVAYVFPANLSNGYAKYTAEAVAHEAGHTFGLQHQGQYNGTTLVQEYNPGNSQVAPIMGNSYYAARGLWWTGTPSNNSSGTQYDLTTLSNATNGFGYRADDYGNSIGTATALTLSNGTFSAAGVVELNTDADFFGFTTTGAATLTLSLGVAQYGAMLDGSLYVYDARGTLLASADTSSLGESLTLSLSAAGTYYVSVTGHGGYGDIGQYTLTGSVAAAQNPQPPVVVTVADPGTPTVTPVSAGDILVGWADNSDNETGFLIQRSTDNGVTWVTLKNVGAGVTSYHDTSVSGGTTYKYRVQAYNDSVSSDFTAGVSGTTVPSAPGSLVPTVNSATQITLTWGDVFGETSYAVERSVDGSTWTQVGTTGANVTTFVDAGLSPGTGYWYRVRAFDATGPSTYSSQTTPVTSPGAPGSVTAVANSATQVTVTWGDVAGETSFVIERSLDGTSGWTQVGTTAAGVTTFVDGARSAGTRYYYRVRAGNAWGMSVYSGVVNALTLPAAPGAPVVTAGSGTQVSVTWSAVTGAATYVVERSTDNATWSTLTTTGTTAVNDLTVSAGTRYYYRVRAVNASGSSGVGTSAWALTRPGSPGSVTATANSATKVTVEWSAVVGAGAYDVERSPDGVSGWTAVAAGVADTSYIDEGLTAETQYYYRVRATNTSGASAYAAPVDATTLEPVVVVIDPAYLIVTPTGSTGMHVVWEDDSNNEDGFLLERSDDNGATWTTVVVTDPNVTSYDDGGLAGGTTYAYRVRAFSGSVLSDFSTRASATTAPAAPATLYLSVVSAGAIKLTWAPAAGAAAYEVERSANGTTGWAKVATTASTSYVNDGLAAATGYYYRVRATGPSGTSDYTAAARGVTVPAAPATVAVKALSSGRLYVSWGNVSRAAGYEVERSTDGVGGWTLVGTTAGASATNMTDLSGLAYGVTYYYRVRATNESGASEYAGPASGLTLLSAPTGVSATASSGGQIKVAWAAEPNAEGFVLERSLDHTNWSTIASVDGSWTGYADGGLAGGTKYYYRVRAVNAAGTSAASALAGATTAQVAPLAPAAGTTSVVQLSPTSVLLSWADLSGNESGFTIEYSVGGKGWKLAGNVPADHSSAQITGLTAGQAYQFRVSAYNEMGFSETSDAASVKVVKALKSRGPTAHDVASAIVLNIRNVKNVYPGLTKSMTPDAATGLTATPYSTSAVQLTWSDNSDSELGFRVEYSVNGRVWLLAGYVTADQTGCRVTGLLKGKAYTFRVSAYNLAGATTRSATAKATMPKVSPSGHDATPSTEADQDTVLNVLKAKAVAPGLPAGLKVA